MPNTPSLIYYINFFKPFSIFTQSLGIYNSIWQELYGIIENENDESYFICSDPVEER